MTTRRRLVPDAEVRRALDTAREYGVVIGAIDIRTDGVTIYPAHTKPENDFERWQEQDKNRDRAAHR